MPKLSTNASLAAAQAQAQAQAAAQNGAKKPAVDKSSTPKTEPISTA